MSDFVCTGGRKEKKKKGVGAYTPLTFCAIPPEINVGKEKEGRKGRKKRGLSLHHVLLDLSTL